MRSLINNKKKKKALKNKAVNEEKQRLKDEKVKKLERDKEIDKLIDDENDRLKAAEALVKDSNKTLSDIIKGDKVDKKSLVKAQYLLDTGLKRSEEVKAKIDELINPKQDKQ